MPQVRLVLLVALLGAVLSATLGCRAAEEKRVFQYLNSQGFGKRATGDANTENYLVVGDSVTIKCSINLTLQLPPQEVDVDGTINLPDIGALDVRGMTRKGLESYLNQAYSGLYERVDIQVTIRSEKGKRYFVVGEVEAPGPKTFVGDLTIFEAVHEAAPRDETANLGRVQLIRGDPVDPLIIMVNFHDFIDYGDTTYNVIVRENDIVYVPPTVIGTFAAFVKKLFYPVQVILQPIQSLLFLLLVSNRQDTRVF